MFNANKTYNLINNIFCEISMTKTHFFFKFTITLCNVAAFTQIMHVKLDYVYTNNLNKKILLLFCN